MIVVQNTKRENIKIELCSNIHAQWIVENKTEFSTNDDGYVNETFNHIVSFNPYGIIWLTAHFTIEPLQIQLFINIESLFFIMINLNWKKNVVCYFNAIE